jgi:glucan endo-1,3-alpha-glucosidase
MRLLVYAPNRVVATVTVALVAALFLLMAIYPIGTAKANARNVTSTADTSIRENAPTTNYGGATTLGADGDEPDGSPTASSSTIDRPNIFAHWHHSTQRAVRGANTVAAYKAEIRKAKAMGFEGFAYNVINVSLELPEIDKLYTAAHNVGGFYLFPSADQCCGMSEASLDRLALDHYNDPARLRVDGGRFGNNLPVMQTWHGESKGAAEWRRIQNEWKNVGKPMFFIPYFAPSRYGGVKQDFSVWDGADPNSQRDDLVDGLYNFDGMASGNNSEHARQENHAYDVAADVRPGMAAMFSCTPVFNRHSGTGQVENRILGDFEGFHAYLACLQGLVRDRPRFIEFVTWNDYLEGSYLGGPYANSALPPTYRGNNLSHAAFRKLSEYYLKWYETGSQPTIARDLIAIAHRSHPENAAGVHANGAGIADDTDRAQSDSGTIRPLRRQFGYSVVEDRLYAAVMLKQAGTVTLRSGSTKRSFNLPAGISEVSMPFRVGSQGVKLARGSQTVLTATSPSRVQSGAVSRFNYNVQTAFAEGP